MEPKTVGEHILKKRLSDGISQAALAKSFGIDPVTLLHWEKGQTAIIPALKLPVVIQFLGYNPEPEPETVGRRLRWKRRSLGWSIREAADKNSVDSSTWEAWERMASWPKYPRFRDFLAEFLDLPNEKLLRGIRSVRAPEVRRGGAGRQNANASVQKTNKLRVSIFANSKTILIVR